MPRRNSTLCRGWGDFIPAGGPSGSVARQFAPAQAKEQVRVAIGNHLAQSSGIGGAVVAGGGGSRGVCGAAGSTRRRGRTGRRRSASGRFGAGGGGGAASTAGSSGLGVAVRHVEARWQVVGLVWAMSLGFITSDGIPFRVGGRLHSTYIALSLGKTGASTGRCGAVTTVWS